MAHPRGDELGSGTRRQAEETADLLDAEIAISLDRIRARVDDATGTETLLDGLDALNERRDQLRRRLDDLPEAGGGAGLHGTMSSDTPLAGLADVLLRARQLERILGDEPAPSSVEEAGRVAAEPLPRPTRLLSRQRDMIDIVRGQGSPPPWGPDRRGL